MPTRWKRSRLARNEEIRNLRRAYLLGGLTILLIVIAIFLGIPSLIKLATFLGELKSTSQEIEPEKTTPPPPPKIYSLPKTVNQPEIKIEGSSEINSKVIVYLNGQPAKEVVTDQNSNFTLTVNLSGDRNEISLQAVDQAGNKSEETEKEIVILDKTPPVLTITFPQSDSSKSELKQIKIKGVTEIEAKLLVNDHLVILDQNGNFEYPLSLSEGENLIKIEAQDEASNKTDKEIKINYSP